EMKNYIIIGLCIVIVLAAAPFVIIAKMRVTRSDSTRIHLIPDMDSQPKFKAQSQNLLFADKRAMRPRIPGTAARGEWYANPIIHDGTVSGEWALRIPGKITPELIQEGRKHYDVYCAPCHGLAGFGEGVIAQRAERLEEGTWTPPTSLHSETVLQRPAGHVFNTITNGIRNMPAYGQQIRPEDRWAIVAYIKALQRSQNASIDDVPPEYRDALKRQQ
ncbi:MAG: cytochrome c, partial [Candidatus Omnitrophica bacterium]|nr:cytochrome c [Candidatus Omnitrophota bacterium]